MLKLTSVLQLILVTTALVHAPLHVVAQDRGIVVSYSLVSSRVTLNEPVQISFAVANRSPDTIVLDLGDDQKGSFLFTLTYPDNSTQRLPLFIVRDGLSKGREVELERSGRFEKTLILNDWISSLRSGAYTLQVELIKPIQSKKGSVVLNPAPFRASFEVLPRDDEALREACEFLVSQIESAKSVDAALDAARALSYIDDPVAVPYLEQALATGKFIEGPIFDGLVRIGNMDAVRVLIRIYKDAGGSEGQPAQGTGLSLQRLPAMRARGALLRIDMQTNNDTIRREIRSVL